MLIFCFTTNFAQPTSILYLTVQPKLYSITSSSWGNMNLPVLPFTGSSSGLGDSMLSNLQICRCLSFSSKAPLGLLLILCPEQQTGMFTVQVNGFTHLRSLPFQNMIKAVQTTWTLLKVGKMDSCSYFSLRMSFRVILFILYVVQLTQVLVTSDFPLLPLLVKISSISRWSDSPQTMSASTAAQRMKGNQA